MLIGLSLDQTLSLDFKIIFEDLFRFWVAFFCCLQVLFGVFDHPRPPWRALILFAILIKLQETATD